MSFKDNEVKQKVLDVLFRNHNKNLFSSHVRESIAQQVADNLVKSNDGSSRSVTENGVVFDENQVSGNPINEPKTKIDAKEVKSSKDSGEVVKPTKSRKPKKDKHESKKPVERSSRRKIKRKIKNPSGTPEDAAKRAGLKSLKNK